MNNNAPTRHAPEKLLRQHFTPEHAHTSSHSTPPKLIQRIIGKSPAIQEVLRKVQRFAELDYPVLIEGESGTGKELVARAFHCWNQGDDKPFISVNCGSITENILHSELFGHARGAFTGAEQDRPGLFEAAHGGTLFLDEIDAMSPAMQEALLRTLDWGEIRRVGETETRRVNVRILAATNVDLESTNFRRDLFFRIAVLRVILPPLRERCEDIPLLAEYTLRRIAAESGQPERKLHKRAVARLMEHPWPGNVRELQNVLKRAVAGADWDTLRERDFHFLSNGSPPKEHPIIPIDEYVRRVHATWSSTLNDEEIAARLGICRKTLWARRKASRS